MIISRQWFALWLFCPQLLQSKSPLGGFIGLTLSIFVFTNRRGTENWPASWLTFSSSFCVYLPPIFGRCRILFGATGTLDSYLVFPKDACWPIAKFSIAFSSQLLSDKDLENTKCPNSACCAIDFRSNPDDAEPLNPALLWRASLRTNESFKSHISNSATAASLNYSFGFSFFENSAITFIFPKSYFWAPTMSYYLGPNVTWYHFRSVPSRWQNFWRAISFSFFPGIPTFSDAK